MALPGPRQVGKTTLALDVGESRSALYLDLESEQDRAKLAQPELYLADHQDKLWSSWMKCTALPACFPSCGGSSTAIGALDGGRGYIFCWAPRPWTCSSNPAKHWPGASPTWNSRPSRAGNPRHPRR